MKKSCQDKVRSHEFACDQYWLMHFSEMLNGVILGNYRTVIKSRSGALAKKILLKKIKEDNPSVDVVSVLT